MYQNKRYLWLIDKLEKNFSLKVSNKEDFLEEKLSTLFEQNKTKIIIQILRLPQISLWSNGTWTDRYQVSLYICDDLEKSYIFAQEIYSFLKKNLSGVDVQDMFSNSNDRQYQNFYFKLIVHEGA